MPDYDEKLPNCLIFGDSVSIGYERAVKERLRGKCNVQHSPWDVSNGGWGSSSAALTCLDNALLSAAAEPLVTSANRGKTIIFFNNGLHNTQNNSTQAILQYKDDISNIAKTFQTLHPFRLFYGLTTPLMTSYNAGDQIIEKLNAQALDAMQSLGIPAVDLYARVLEKCAAPGEKSYVDCPICATLS